MEVWDETTGNIFDNRKTVPQMSGDSGSECNPGMLPTTMWCLVGKIKVQVGRKKKKSKKSNHDFLLVKKTILHSAAVASAFSERIVN